MSRFKTIKELQDYCNQQYSVILKMQAEAETYQTKIQHLEELLRTGGDNVTLGSNELEVCKIEISRLYSTAMQGPLEDKDVRKFDTLVKCLLAIQGKTPEKKPKQKEEVMSPEDLIALALQSMPESEGS
jgi:hypothetical protein